MVAGTSFAKGILAIELKRFPYRLPKAFKKLHAGALLAVDAGHFLDPADPPIAVLFHESGTYSPRMFCSPDANISRAQERANVTQ